MIPALFQGVLDRGLLCLEVSKSSFLDLSGRAEVSWLQRSPLLSPEAQESAVPKHPLRPGSRMSLPRPGVPVCCFLPRLTQKKLIRSPSPDRWHSGTQPLPGTCCCCGRRVALILARCRTVTTQCHQLRTCAFQTHTQLGGGGADT